MQARNAPTASCDSTSLAVYSWRSSRPPPKSGPVLRKCRDSWSRSDQELVRTCNSPLNHAKKSACSNSVEHAMICRKRERQARTGLHLVIYHHGSLRYRSSRKNDALRRIENRLKPAHAMSAEIGKRGAAA